MLFDALRLNKSSAGEATVLCQVPQAATATKACISRCSPHLRAKFPAKVRDTKSAATSKKKLQTQAESPAESPDDDNKESSKSSQATKSGNTVKLNLSSANLGEEEELEVVHDLCLALSADGRCRCRIASVCASFIGDYCWHKAKSQALDLHLQGIPQSHRSAGGNSHRQPPRVMPQATGPADATVASSEFTIHDRLVAHYIMSCPTFEDLQILLKTMEDRTRKGALILLSRIPGGIEICAAIMEELPITVSTRHLQEISDYTESLLPRDIANRVMGAMHTDALMTMKKVLHACFKPRERISRCL